MTIHLKSTTRQQMIEQLGAAPVVVGMKAFDAHGEKRCRYTVTKPNGKKFFHFIGYANGSVVLAA